MRAFSGRRWRSTKPHTSANAPRSVPTLARAMPLSKTRRLLLTSSAASSPVSDDLLLLLRRRDGRVPSLAGAVRVLRGELRGGRQGVEEHPSRLPRLHGSLLRVPQDGRGTVKQPTGEWLDTSG